jgi:hypothetical protein
MAYVDKLVDTQDTVMHDFYKEDHNGGGNRLRKRPGEAYVTDPPKPSTFLEGDLNMVIDDQCQFHPEAKNTMRECEEIKSALEVPPEPKKARRDNNDNQNYNHRYDNRNRRLDRRDYRDRRPYRCNDDRDHYDYHRDYHRDDLRDDYSRNDHHEDNYNDRRNNCREDQRDERHDDRRDDCRRQDDHTATTTIARNALHHHHQKGQAQRHLSNCQPRDQLHHLWSPSDQEQQAAAIKHNGDRARQH